MKCCLMSFVPIPCLQITGFKNSLAQLCEDEIPGIIPVAQLALLEVMGQCQWGTAVDQSARGLPVREGSSGLTLPALPVPLSLGMCEEPLGASWCLLHPSPPCWIPGGFRPLSSLSFPFCFQGWHRGHPRSLLALVPLSHTRCQLLMAWSARALLPRAAIWQGQQPSEWP